MSMAGKWMVFGAFNDGGASASSSPIWMTQMVDSMVGDSIWSESGCTTTALGRDE
jgi:hypothetical protein